MCDGSAQQFSGLYGKDCRYDREGHALLAGQLLTLKQYGGKVAFAPRGLILLKHDKYTVAYFREEFTINDRSYDAGSRRLFLKKQRNNWYVTGDIKIDSAKEQQFLAALDSLNTSKANHKDIRNLVDRWIVSWQEGNMKEYGSFYAGDFYSRGMNRQAWLEYKKRLSRVSQNVRIGIKNFTISCRSRDRAVATFEQHYRSSLVEDVGIKKLYLKCVDNSWKICQETWRAKK